MIKAIGKFFRYLYTTTQSGFYYICLVLSNGFFFYFYFISSLLEKLFHLSFFRKMREFFQTKQKEPTAFLMLVLLFFIGAFLHTYLYVDKNDITYIDADILQTDEIQEEKPAESIASDKETYSGNEINLYRKYGSYDFNQINFEELRAVNPDVVAWLRVDGTNVNYPIVQTSDNDFYLNHDITKNPKASGWTFMDYRNSIDMSDDNTIFYGHNLLNRTSFGSLANVFTDNWFQSSNHYIVVVTESKKYVYQIFSCYYIDPEVYYLQNNFYRDSDYQEFLTKLKSRSNYDFGLEVSASDKIITLSTCTDDNKGRKVVHAKLIEG